MIRYSGISLVILAVAGCSGGGGDPSLLIGPNATMSESADVAYALGERIGRILGTEGFTQFDDLPASGTASYRGILEGMPSGGDGPSTAYFADLLLTLDFGSDTLEGTAKNFVTDVAGFEHPSGTATVTGTMYPAGSDAEFDISVSGYLSEGPNAANYDAFSTFGWLIGTDGDGMFGDLLADFTWTSGANDGKVSSSDGDFGAERY